MLADLSIRNLAIIDSLHVSFHQGLTVLTGETGAGKSIIIDAVNLIMGGRASADLIRTGEEEATVEALFVLPVDAPLGLRLADMGLDFDGELLVKRVVSRSGRNRVFIGGGLSTLAILSEISRELVNIYGQHESQTLLRPENHLRLLDGFSGLDPLRASYSALYDRYRETEARIRELDQGEREAARRLDLLSFQAEEIRTAALVPGEEEELTGERSVLVNAERLCRGSEDAYEALYGDEASVLHLLAQVKAKIADISSVDTSLSPLLDVVVSASAQLEDAALTLRGYGARIEADPARLEAVDERLDLIRRLKKKYAPTVEEIIAYGDEAAREVDLLLNRDRARSDLDRELELLAGRVREQGRELSVKRREAATQLKAAMEREIHQLAMKHALFDVAFEELTEPRQTGIDGVTFLFSPNPGEEPKPLARIASGGELSRLMLALKQVHPESDVPTLIFDEVDTGIGGATSALVGEKLKRVSRGQQVLCITHLPQVAAFADHHYKVEKQVQGGRTATEVTLLQEEERVAEVARMLGGVAITGTTLDHAREMIDGARRTVVAG